MEKIVIGNLPIPHSVNQGLTNGRFNKRFIKTHQARFFDQQMQSWIRSQHQDLVKLLPIIQAIQDGYQLKVDYYFLFHVERVIWKRKKTLRPLDVDNRIKPLQDWVAKIIGIDDTHFKKGFREIISVEKKEDQCAIVVLTKTKLYSCQTKEQALTEIMTNR
jgi:Holliday junction resolvase RusA-like endonuclease